jgi:acyl carrier protein
MNRDELVLGIREVFLADFDLEVLDDDANLIETGHLDSLDVVRLLAALEKRFGLQIEMADLEVRDIGTVSGLAELVERHT